MSNGSCGPLAGVRVLDLTRVLSGPFGTSWLSDMGADVIKIEALDEKNIDSTRVCGPYKNGESVYFATLNRNKRTVTLNLKDPKGKKMFLDLVKQADVVTENYRPGVMNKLGLGYEELKKVNKRLVMFSLSGYGSYGPYAQRPGYDVVAQGMSGIMSLTGYPDSPPTRCGPSIGDVTGGMNLVIGVLAALYRAKVSGEGQYVESSLVDATLALCTQDFMEYAVSRKVPQRLGNGYSLWCPYGTYSAKDGYFQIGVGTETHFAIFCGEILKMPELAKDERFNEGIKRVENREAMDAFVNAWCGELTVKEVVDRLNEVGIPACPVYDFDDIVADENFTKHREMVKRMEHPVIGEFSYINMPVRFAGTPLVEPRAAGFIGQYNAEVYGELLGLGEEELAELKRDGII